MVAKDEVVFLYVRTFKWFNGEEKIMFNNQPFEGRVYKAYKDSDSGNYKVKLDSINNMGPSGILMDNLSGSFPRWECDLIEVDETVMTEYDIHPDDMNMIAEELMSGAFRKDLDNVIGNNNPGMIIPPDYILDSMRKVEEEMSPIKKLAKADPIGHNILNNIIEYLSDSLLSETSDDFASKLLQESDKLGRGGNLGLVLWYLQTYIKTPKPAKQFLYMSMYFIYLELIRLHLNKTDE